MHVSQPNYLHFSPLLLLICFLLADNGDNVDFPVLLLISGYSLRVPVIIHSRLNNGGSHKNMKAAVLLVSE
jgi:hypothetical protein